MLKKWSKRQFGTVRRTKEIWCTVGGNHWRFYGNYKQKKVILPMYDMWSYSVRDYRTVKGDQSPYDGDTTYWSTKLASFSGANEVTTYLLRKQKQRCAICNIPFFFTDEVIYHVDHIVRRADKGTNNVPNLQVIHTSCHELKTAEENTKKKPLRGGLKTEC